MVGGIIYAQVPRLASQITDPAPRRRSKTSYGSCGDKTRNNFREFLDPFLVQVCDENETMFFNVQEKEQRANLDALE